MHFTMVYTGFFSVIIYGWNLDFKNVVNCYQLWSLVKQAVLWGGVEETVNPHIWFLKKGQPLPLSLIFIFSYRRRNLVASGIGTSIVWVEGEDADHPDHHPGPPIDILVFDLYDPTSYLI